MTYLVADDLPTAPAGERFRALLARPGILQMPGAHNGMAALQAKAAGFEALYLSGAAMTASMGIPDLGMITVDEVCFFIRQIARATGLPLLVDGDTGYGEALNVMHMVRSFEDAGAAAVHIEDQLLPKKCGHLNDKKLADAHDMAAKIAAARRARRHLFIVARTDAAASEGMDGAVARAKLYLEAGADAIFPEALTTAEMFRDFAARVDAPLLANMTEFGRTPFFTAAEFEDMGYQMVIWPVSSLRVANKAQAELYAAIRRDGGTQTMVDRMQTRAELYAAIGYHDYEALDASIVTTIIPEAMPQRRAMRIRRMNRRRLARMCWPCSRRSRRARQPVNPTGPQPELPKEKLVIVTRDGARHDFNVEMATAPDQQTVGLMFRPSVPPDGGMLFDWGTPRASQMWMRNTIASLDMVFINADGTIRSIAENTVPESLAIIDSRGPVRATLELAAGTTAQAEHPGWRQGGAADFRQRAVRPCLPRCRP